jgi:hypothetical protein
MDRQPGGVFTRTLGTGVASVTMPPRRGSLLHPTAFARIV